MILDWVCIRLGLRDDNIYITLFYGIFHIDVVVYFSTALDWLIIAES